MTLLRPTRIQRAAVRHRAWLLLVLFNLLVVIAAYQVSYIYHIHLGQPGDLVFLRDFHSGAVLANSSYRWSADESAIIFPGVTQNQAYLLSLRAAAGPRPDKAPTPQLEVLVNGVRVEQVEVPPEGETYRITLELDIVGRAADLVLALKVPPFVPNQYDAQVRDARKLGLLVEWAQLTPDAESRELLALPSPWYLAGWFFVGCLWLGVLLQTPLARSRVKLALGFVVGTAALGIALAVARAWTAGLFWYICGGLVLALPAWRYLPRWWTHVRAGAYADFSFLETLGIADLQLRRAAAAVVAVLSSSLFLFNAWMIVQTHRLVDLYVMALAARVLVEGGDIYNLRAIARMARRVGAVPFSSGFATNLLQSYPHPPSDAVFNLRWILFSFAEAKNLYLIESIVLYAATVFLIWHALKTLGRRSVHPVIFVVLFASFEPTRYVLHAGQSTILILFLAALSFWAYAKGYARLAGMALGVNILIKVAPVMLLVYWAWNREWRVAVSTLVTAAVLVAATLPLSGIELWYQFAAEVFPQLSNGTGYIHNQSLPALVLRLAYGPMGLMIAPGVPQVRIPVLLLQLGLVGLALWFTRGRRQAPPDLRFAVEYSIWVTIIPIISPIAWDHYFALLLLPIAVLLSALLNGALAAGRASILVLGLLVALVLFNLPQGVYLEAGNVWLQSPILWGALIILLLLFERAAKMEREWAIWRSAGTN